MTIVSGLELGGSHDAAGAKHIREFRPGLAASPPKWARVRRIACGIHIASAQLRRVQGEGRPCSKGLEITQSLHSGRRALRSGGRTSDSGTGSRVKTCRGACDGSSGHSRGQSGAFPGVRGDCDRRRFACAIANRAREIGTVSRLPIGGAGKGHPECQGHAARRRLSGGVLGGV